jgi:hypothetical protein
VANCTAAGSVSVGCQDPTTASCGAQNCCTTAASGGLVGSVCQTAACAAPNQQVCSSGNGVGDAAAVPDPSTCIPASSANTCVAPVGTPINVFGVCVLADAGGGGG